MKNSEQDLKEWLVEIRLVKSSSSSLKAVLHENIVTYEEVLAKDINAARRVGLNQFDVRARYEPVLKRRLAQNNIRADDCYAPDAVQLT